MAEYEGVDALLAAITDASLPEGARDDVAFMAEHRSAREDVDVLREQLVIIGDALADSGKAAEPGRASQRSQGFRRPGGPRRSGDGRPGGTPKTRSRHRGALAVGVGALAAAAVASMVVGMGWLVAHNGMGGADDQASSSDAKTDSANSFSAPGYIACSRLIAEGTVTEVVQVPGTEQDRITLDVYHSYKPAKGEKEVTFLMDQNVDPRLHEGDEVLVGIGQHAPTPDIWTTGEKNIARDRAWIVKALPAARGMRCER
ncbi:MULTISPECIES: hypothetical protein [unclassified Streptomyces]|uniref:hypothetical protein n=1 Tax=unclassified Streptomyces TaxID=2593676 RepID=UPI00224F3069|nr:MULTISPECIES: hypothetical protein [unclassified Streptomyces]MCX4990900.1 hypothetical protein [Streptomyces sp. NBC_00568]MCX5003869.1 hypothetical protein [Streptomyces sp. NBC_00638]